MFRKKKVASGQAQSVFAFFLRFRIDGELAQVIAIEHPFLLNDRPLHGQLLLRVALGERFALGFGLLPGVVDRSARDDCYRVQARPARA